MQLRPAAPRGNGCRTRTLAWTVPELAGETDMSGFGGSVITPRTPAARQPCSRSPFPFRRSLAMDAIAAASARGLRRIVPVWASQLFRVPVVWPQTSSGRSEARHRLAHDQLWIWVI